MFRSWAVLFVSITRPPAHPATTIPQVVVVDEEADSVVVAAAMTVADVVGDAVVEASMIVEGAEVVVGAVVDRLTVEVSVTSKVRR